MNAIDIKELAQALEALIKLNTAFTVFSALCTIIMLVSLWKIFVKAGEPGWKVLIPFYDVFIFFKIVWETKWFWLPLIAGLLSSILSTIALNSNSVKTFGTLVGISGLVFMISSLITLVFYFILNVKLAKAFGKSGLFSLGLIFLSPIFYAILAFGPAAYVRSDKPMARLPQRQG